MAVFELLFLYLLFFIFHLRNVSNAAAAATAVIGHEECATYFCSGIEIRFPFQFPQRQSSNNSCGYPGFDLSCSNRSQTIVKLPGAGDFSVSALSYSKQAILMDDPENCLPKRLLNFSLIGSPFSAPEYRSYTYLNCSTNVTMYRYTHFPCLGGGDNKYKVYVGPSSLSSYIPPSCVKVASVMAPAVAFGSSNLRGDYIKLKWGHPRCGRCERKGGTCGLKNLASLEVGCSNLPNPGLPRAAKYGITFGAGIPGILCLIGLGCYITSKFKPPHRPNGNDNSIPQRTITTMGLDGPTINSYPKIIIGESKRLPMANNGDDNCAICLCEYRPKEVLRSIPECQHFFHAKCVDEWLKLNAACPLCRTTPDGSYLSSVSRSSQSSLSVSSSILSVARSATDV